MTEFVDPECSLAVDVHPTGLDPLYDVHIPRQSEATGLRETRGYPTQVGELLGFVRDTEAGLDIEADELRQDQERVPLDAPDRAERLQAIAVAAAYLAGQRHTLSGVMDVIMAPEGTRASAIPRPRKPEE